MPSARLRLGVFLPLVGLDWPSLLARARLVERLGYDSLWLDDHFWFPGRPDQAHLEVWSALCGLATATTRLTLGPLVLCQSYRSPALVAKMAASLAAISGGRLVLGLGAGWMAEEYAAYGYRFPSARCRLDELAEGLEVMRRLWRDERASFAGQQHSVRDAPCLPKPERLPVLLGGASDRLLEVAATYADVWNCPNPAWRDLAAKRDRLRRCCEQHGRDPETIVVSEQVLVVIGRSAADVKRERERAAEAMGSFADLDSDVHVGTPEQVAESLRRRQALGVSLLTVMFGDFGSAEQIECFAAEVAPLL
jgi:probable F420-dependent oxidoreductase